MECLELKRTFCRQGKYIGVVTWLTRQGKTYRRVYEDPEEVAEQLLD